MSTPKHLSLQRPAIWIDTADLLAWGPLAEVSENSDITNPFGQYAKDS